MTWGFQRRYLNEPLWDGSLPDDLERLEAASRASAMIRGGATLLECIGKFPGTTLLSTWLDDQRENGLYFGRSSQGADVVVRMATLQEREVVLGIPQMKTHFLHQVEVWISPTMGPQRCPACGQFVPLPIDEHGNIAEPRIGDVAIGRCAMLLVWIDGYRLRCLTMAEYMTFPDEWKHPINAAVEQNRILIGQRDAEEAAKAQVLAAAADVVNAKNGSAFPAELVDKSGDTSI